MIFRSYERCVIKIEKYKRGIIMGYKLLKNIEMLATIVNPKLK